MMYLHKLPYITVTIIFLALTVHLAPGATALFMYKQSAFFEGDWWRPATSWFTHFSTSHLVWNLLTLAIVGLLVELKQRTATVTLILLSAVLHYALLLDPEIEFYSGISSFTIAMFTLLICDKITSLNARSNLWAILLLIIVIKVCVEQFTMETVFASGNFRPLPVAHLVGLLSAIAVFRLSTKKEPRGKPQGSFQIQA